MILIAGLTPAKELQMLTKEHKAASSTKAGCLSSYYNHKRGQENAGKEVDLPITTRRNDA